MTLGAYLTHHIPLKFNTLGFFILFFNFSNGFIIPASEITLYINKVIGNRDIDVSIATSLIQRFQPAHVYL